MIQRPLKSMKVLGLCLFLIPGLLIGSGQTEAYESFTATIEFYEGFSLTEGMEIDPRILTLIFNPSEKVEFVLPGLEEDLFTFNFAEWYFGYDPTVHSPILVPEHVHMAVCEGSVADMTPQRLGELDFVPDPPPVVLDEDEIVIFLTATDTYYMLGHIVLNVPDWTLEFQWQKVEATTAVPEMTSSVLLGIGCLVVFRMVRRKQTCSPQRHGGTEEKRSRR